MIGSHLCFRKIVHTAGERERETILKKRNKRAEGQVRVTFFHLALGMRGCSIITKVRLGEFTWPSSC